MYQVKLPKQINPLQFGQHHERVCGYFLTEHMSRVLELVESVAEKVEVELNFTLNDLNELKRPIAQGMIQTSATLICQRCLQPFTFSVIGNINWVFVRNDAEAKKLQHDYDPVLFENDKVDLFLQVEDEIILNLPMIALHQDLANCRPAAKKHDEVGKSAKVNPFAELANLKLKK